MSGKVQSNQTTNTEESVSTSVALIEQLFPPPRPFAVRLWEGTELPADADACLVLNHPAALRRMLAPPIELSMGEAFIQGDFDIQGDIFSIFPALDAIGNRSFSAVDLVALMRMIRSLPRPSSGARDVRGPARLRGRVHSRQRDQEAIHYHYDVGNDFYALWLDRNMQYSCAYFETGEEDLDTAQERKLDYLCRKLRLKPDERLLDIGCGWGGLAVYAARKYGVQVLGITLSEEQATYANNRIAHAGLGDAVTVKLLDYRDIGAETFDKIVSIGMFEHVGQKLLPEYFARAFRHLRPGGLFLNHGIARRAPGAYQVNAKLEQPGSPEIRPARRSTWGRLIDRRILGTGSFVQRYVFPDGELVPVSQVNIIAEQAGFEVRDVENLREHYALTLHHWVRRLEAHEAEATEIVGEPTYRVWRLYMAASAYGFSTGKINVNQTLLAKPLAGKSGLPLTRADLYGFPGKIQRETVAHHD